MSTMTTAATGNAAHTKKGVLSGIRVLDFTWKTVGPWAPRLLTHYGAEVIHVERAGGFDDHRYATHRSITTDDEKHLMRAHDYVYVPPGVRHSFTNTGTQGLVFLVVTTPTDDEQEMH